MRKVLVLALVCLTLSGCAIANEIRLAQEREDVAKCMSYGARLGSPEFVQCRAQLDAARTVASASTQPIPASNHDNSSPMPQRPVSSDHDLWRPGRF
jgi:hypothetical protein